MKQYSKSSRILALLLVCLLIVSASPLMLFASAASPQFTYYKNKSGITLTGLKSSLSGTLTIPSTYKGKKVTGLEMHDNVDKITKVMIPASVEDIHPMVLFSGFDRLREINVDSKNKYYSSKNGVLFNKSKTLLIAYPMKKADVIYSVPSTVKTIGSYAFAGAQLRNIVLPSSLKTICCEAFYYEKKLTSLTLPNSVTNLEMRAFVGCTSLKKVVLGKNIKKLDYMVFADCPIDEITIPASVSHIDEDAFDVVKAIKVDKNNKKYSSLNGVLYNKDKTRLLIYPLGKTAAVFKMPSTVKTGGIYNNYLRVVRLSANLKDYYIGGKALETVVIPYGIKMLPSLSDCKKINSVVIPNGIGTIKSYTFKKCAGLKTVTLGKNVKTVEQDTFALCSSLTTVNFRGSKTAYEKITVDSNNKSFKSAKVNYNCAAPSVKLSASTASLRIGKTKTLKATVTGLDKTAKWISEDSSIVSVSSTGKLTAKKTGTCLIAATANGTAAFCTVTVK